MRLTAVIDWRSRYVLSWERSNTMESTFYVDALERALAHGTPEIFNTDQGSQFISNAFTSILLGENITISMDGRGRALNNVFIECHWWTVKYEKVYPESDADGHALYRGLDGYFDYYNHERQHSAHDKRTPAEVFMEGAVRTLIASDAVASPSALRAAPSRTGSTPRRHHRRAARWPPEHETGSRRFPLKFADPWSKFGGRRTASSRSITFCEPSSVRNTDSRNR